MMPPRRALLRRLSICLGLLSSSPPLLFPACYFMTDHDLCTRLCTKILRTFPHRDSVRDCQETVIVFQVWPLAGSKQGTNRFWAWWMVPLALCQVALAMSCAVRLSLHLYHDDAATTILECGCCPHAFSGSHPFRGIYYSRQACPPSDRDQVTGI